MPKAELEEYFSTNESPWLWHGRLEKRSKLINTRWYSFIKISRLAVFNVIIQAQKHYTGFSAVLKAAMENELSFIAEHTGRNEHVLLSYNDFLAQNIRVLFVKSLEVFQENRVLQLWSIF